MKTFEPCRVEPKKVSFLLRNLIILLSGIIISMPSLSYAGIQESIVKIFTTAKSYDYAAPWQKAGDIENLTGSGCIISGRQIITNAHVVANATFIEVKKHGNPKRFTAGIIAVAHDADLALLKVEDDDFFTDSPPLKFGNLPELRDRVTVYGFPEGGEGLSVTQGIISRIEITSYVHSCLELLGLQVDAAINSGNSGGPAIIEGKIVGIAMQAIEEAENIGYLVSPPVINHFLKDMDDGHYDGFPDMGIITQPLENAALRALTKLPDSESGEYVSLVIPGTSADGFLMKGDTILSIDNHTIANDGTALLRPGLRINSRYYIRQHQIGENVNVIVWRNGAEKSILIPLNSKSEDILLLEPPQYDLPPEYYILAGFVFSPLTYNYLKSDSSSRSLFAYIRTRKKAGEQAVIISKILSSEMTTGYQRVCDERVVAVNGESFAKFREFASLINKALKKDDLIVLETEENTVLAVSPVEHRKNEKKLLERYGIERPFRVN